MSDFKTLKGLYIKHVSSDPSNLIEGQIWYNTTSQTIKVAPLIEAWASGGDLGTARYELGSAGTQTAALGFGGNTPAGSPTKTNATEEYGGSSWTAGGALGTARYAIAGCGTQTAALGFGGFDASPPGLTATEEYDGSTWTTGGALPVQKRGMGRAGRGVSPGRR